MRYVGSGWLMAAGPNPIEATAFPKGPPFFNAPHKLSRQIAPTRFYTGLPVILPITKTGDLRRGRPVLSHHGSGEMTGDFPFSGLL